MDILWIGLMVILLVILGAIIAVVLAAFLLAPLEYFAVKISNWWEKKLY